MIKTYMMLTKPGIILGNLVTTAAGFFLASKGHFNPLLFTEMFIGLGFVIASAGVLNNCYDRAIDAKMKRTQYRALVTGEITLSQAIVFGSFLGILGLSILLLFTNILTAIVALTGFSVYLVLYAICKYRSFYGTLVGSIAGAIPPVVGYTAVSNQLDLGAFIIFAVLVLWQMPHFFAIALYRIEDYKAASIPVLPIERGIHATKIQMFLYILSFMGTAFLLSLMGYTGMTTLYMAAMLSGIWLLLCLAGFKAESDYAWAKQMFVFSLVVIMTLCLTITLDVVI